MKSQLPVLTVGLAVVVAVVWSVHLSKSDQACPRPSAASVEMLFDPCQAYDEASATISPVPVPTGTAETPVATPARSAPTPAQIVSQDFQLLNQEHATVGVAPAKDH